MSKKPKKTTIYAYGFDRLGFKIPSAEHETGTFIVRFIGFNSNASLDEADGLVIPSGIFEEFDTVEGLYGLPEERIRYFKHDLAEREKQFHNAFKADKWAAFALGSVKSGLPARNWTDTDLAKKVLHFFATKVVAHDPDPYITCKSDEFKKYLGKFGLAQTRFTPLESDNSARILAESNGAWAGMAIRGDLFFLPFFSNKRDGTVLVEVVTELVAAVLEYKRKNDFFLPAWLDSLEFASEAKNSAEIQDLEKRLVNLTEAQKKWRRFKGILCTSGRNLNEIVVEVLRDFFHCDLKSEEKYVEDALIYDGSNKPAFVVEIKGVNGGLKREHVNQVDSHRERLGLDSIVPGLLIINDFMDVEDLDERRAKIFDAQHLSHATNNNIRVLRTTALFDIMLRAEDSKERTAAFLALCSSGAPLVTV